MSVNSYAAASAVFAAFAGFSDSVGFAVSAGFAASAAFPIAFPRAYRLKAFSVLFSKEN